MQDAPFPDDGESAPNKAERNAYGITGLKQKSARRCAGPHDAFARKAIDPENQLLACAPKAVRGDARLGAGLRTADPGWRAIPERPGSHGSLPYGLPAFPTRPEAENPRDVRCPGASRICENRGSRLCADALWQRRI